MIMITILNNNSYARTPARALSRPAARRPGRRSPGASPSISTLDRTSLDLLNIITGDGV